MITKYISTGWQMALIAIQYLRRRKLRTVLTTLAIVFGVAIIFAVNLALPSVEDSFKKTMTATTGTVDLRVSSVTGEASLGQVDQFRVGLARRQPGKGVGNVCLFRLSKDF